MKYTFANKITEPLYDIYIYIYIYILSHCMKLGKCSKGKKINQNTEERLVLFFFLLFIKLMIFLSFLL